MNTIHCTSFTAAAALAWQLRGSVVRKNGRWIVKTGAKNA